MAYAIGILHRDISPANIMIFGKDEMNKTSDESYKTTISGGMLIDWDLCKIVGPNGKQDGACQDSCTVSQGGPGM